MGEEYGRVKRSIGRWRRVLSMRRVPGKSLDEREKDGREYDEKDNYI